MNLRFREEDWTRVEQDWELFWNRELARPMVWFNCYDPSSGPFAKKQPFIPQYGPKMSAKEIIEIETIDLERQYFVGDTFPKFWLNFGAGSMAAYMGAGVLVSNETVWFEPLGKELRDIRIEVDKDCFWYTRVQEVMEAALSLWNGAVQIGFSDIKHQ